MIKWLLAPAHRRDAISFCLGCVFRRRRKTCICKLSNNDNITLSPAYGGRKKRNGESGQCKGWFHKNKSASFFNCSSFSAPGAVIHFCFSVQSLSSSASVSSCLRNSRLEREKLLTEKSSMGIISCICPCAQASEEHTSSYTRLSTRSDGV